MTTPLIAAVSEFLTPEQVAALVQADLVSPAAFRFVTVADLRAAPFHLTIGNASRVLDAANPRRSATAPLQVTVSAPEAPARNLQIEAALQAAAANPDKSRPLLDLGIEHVVLAADDRITIEYSLGLIAHLESGGRVPATWLGHKIAEVRSLATPPVWCSPRPPHRELQAGADEVSRIPWAQLGVDRLRVAAHGYARGFFDGMTEAQAYQVMAREKSPTRVGPGAAQADTVTRTDLELDMKATGTRPEAYDHVLFPTRRSSDSSRGGGAPPPVTGKIFNDLYNWFLVAVDASELRHTVGFLPGGNDMRHKLPDTGVSRSEFTFAAVEVLQRHGFLTDTVARAQLHAQLLALRPRRSDELAAIFSR